MPGVVNLSVNYLDSSSLQHYTVSTGVTWIPANIQWCIFTEEHTFIAWDVDVTPKRGVAVVSAGVVAFLYPHSGLTKRQGYIVLRCNKLE